MKTKEIPLFCNNEDRVVGFLTLPIGKSQLTPNVIVANYRPVTERYTLVSKLANGQYLKCPRCASILSIRAVADSEDDDRSIILGMVVEVT